MRSLLSRRAKAITVEIYSKPDCHLCEVAKQILLKVKQEIPFEFLQTDITNDRELFEIYKEQIPVVFIDGRKLFKYRVEEKKLRKILKRGR